MKSTSIRKELKEEIRRAYLQGIPTFIIARNLGISEAEVVRVLEKSGYIR